MPPLVLTKLTSLDMIYTMRLYVILLALFSSALCYHLIRKIFHDKWIILFVAYTLAYVLLILPAHQFGQREHFLVIFIFPYLFAAGARLSHVNMNPGLAALIGILAGIGFAIKPHFLFAFVLVELYFCFKTRRLMGWVCVESVAALLTIVLYAIVIGLFFSAYWQVVYPLWWPYYQLTEEHSLRSILLYPSLLFCIATLLFYFFIRHSDRYFQLNRVLSLAAFGFILSFLIPRANWYYHILPALSVLTVLLAILLGEMIEKTRHAVDARYTAFYTMIASFLFAFPILQSSALLVDSLFFYASRQTYTELIKFLNSHKNNSFDYFSNTHSLIILEKYAHANYVGRFPSLWWYYDNAFLGLKNPSKVAKAYAKQFPFFEDSVAADLMIKRPQFVIIDTESENAKYFGKEVNYIDELSNSIAFKKAWQPYHYLITIDQYEIYTRVTQPTLTKIH